MSKPRKRMAVAFARNLACGLIESIEVCWQQEIYDLTDEEVGLVEKELKKLSAKITKTVDFENLPKVLDTTA